MLFRAGPMGNFIHTVRIMAEQWFFLRRIIVILNSLFTQVHKHMHTRMHACTHACMHTHTHTHSLSHFLHTHICWANLFMHGCDSTGVTGLISEFKCTHKPTLFTFVSVFTHTEAFSLHVCQISSHTQRLILFTLVSVCTHTHKHTHTHTHTTHTLTPTLFISISIFTEVYSPQVCCFHTQS